MSITADHIDWGLNVVPAYAVEAVYPNGQRSGIPATVAATKRGAIVNWLVTFEGTMVYNNMPDALIADMWIKRKYQDAQVIEVKVVRGDPVKVDSFTTLD